MKRKNASLAAALISIAAAGIVRYKTAPSLERQNLRDSPISSDEDFKESLGAIQNHADRETNVAEAPTDEQSQTSAPTGAPTTAPFYRFWRGVPSLPQDQFLQKLPDFFKATQTWLTGHDGVAYLPAIPSTGAPGGIGEIALVGYASQADYEREKATPAGQQYQNLHWTLFDKNQSKSGTPGPLGDSIQPDTPYDVLGTPVDWQKGCSTFWFALSADPSHFLDQDHLYQHVMAAKKLTKYNLDGYVFLATPQYEIAYQHWPDCNEQNAFQNTPEGKVVQQSAQGLFKSDLMEWIDPIRSVTDTIGPIQPGQSLDVLFPLSSP